MTDQQKKDKDLKTGKSYGLYNHHITVVHKAAKTADVSDSIMVQAMIEQFETDPALAATVKTRAKAIKEGIRKK